MIYQYELFKKKATGEFLLRRLCNKYVNDELNGHYVVYVL